jgi:hypothetical protein
VDQLPGRFLGFADGVLTGPEAAAIVHRDIARLLHAVSPWRSDRDYLDVREVAADTDRFFGPDSVTRWGAVRSRFNADRVVRSNHEI